MSSPSNMLEVWGKNLPTDPGAQDQRYLVEQKKARKVCCLIIRGDYTNLCIYIYIYVYIYNIIIQ